MNWKKQIDRGVELLEQCHQLQTEKDGVNRPKLFEIDKSKTLDQFAMDVSQAATNMNSLYMLFPMMNDLAELGRKLESEGKIEVTVGDSLSRSALDYLLNENGLKQSVN
jgi:hypothetical protein